MWARPPSLSALCRSILPGMIKSIAFMPRRRDLSRAAFRDYYETQHVTLALRHFTFGRYIRNHLADDQEPGFDCLSEFWHPDPTVVAPLMAGPVGDIMRADERAFTDQSNIRAALAEEIPLTTPKPDTKPGSVKTILLLQGDNRETLIDAAKDAASHRASRMTLDLLSPFDDRPIPCNALLMACGNEPLPFSPPSGWSISYRLATCPNETPIERHHDKA